MPTIYWQGTADAVAQVSSGSIDSVDATPANNTFTVTVGGVAISQVGTTDAQTTAAALVALLNASTHPYFAAVTWTAPGSGVITGTADTAGVPFVAALTETGAGTGAVTDFSDDTASSGPNDYSTAANWSGGAIPTTGDDVVIPRDTPNVCWGLAQSGVAIASLTVQSGAGRIGLDATRFATSADGATTSTTRKPEYRTHYLTVASDVVVIGENVGAPIAWNQGRVKVSNQEAGASTNRVITTPSSSADSNKPAVRLLANHASAAVYVRSAQGGVGIAMDTPGETATVGTVSASGGTVTLGEGVTVTTWTSNGGSHVLRSAGTVTTATCAGGALTIEGDQLVTTLNVSAGTCTPNNVPASGSAISTANLTGGTTDATASAQARTWGTVNHSAGATLTADAAVLTITTYNEPSSGVYTITAEAG